MGTNTVIEREAINPQTKERIVVPAYTKPYCKFGKSLKQKVKNLKT
jgi:nucleoid DNA-binding protein